MSSHLSSFLNFFPQTILFLLQQTNEFKSQLSSMMISSIRMHNFEFSKETVENEDAVHDEAKNADWLSSFEISEEQSDEGEGENCAEENYASWSHCSFTNLKIN
mgnify:CR=1 FL=1